MDPKPIKEFTLKGSFYEMGQGYVAELGDDLVKQMALYQEVIVPKNPQLKAIFETKAQQLLELGAQHLPQKTKEFLEGCTEKAEELKLNLSYQDFIVLDQLLMLSKLSVTIQKQAQPPSHCSVLMMSHDKTVGVGRNFDWGKSVLKAFTHQPIVVHLHCTEEGFTTPTIGIGQVGMVSFPTVITANTQAAINSASANMSPEEPFFNLTRPYYLASLTLESMQASNYEQLKDRLLSIPVDSGFIISLTGPNQQMSCIEAAPYNKERSSDFKNRLREPMSSNTLNDEYFTSQLKGRLVVTNFFQLTDWEQYLGVDYPTQDNPSHAMERNRNLVNLSDEAYKNFDGTHVLKTFKSLMSKGINEGDNDGSTQYYPGSREGYETPTATYYQALTRFKQKEEPVRTTIRVAQESEPGKAEMSDWYLCQRP